MPADTERPINWWLPVLGIAAFAAILGIWIAVNTWDFTGHRSPDRYSPWKESAQSGRDGSADLAANFVPQWTPDGRAILFAVTRGFPYGEPPEGASLPKEEIYEGNIYSTEALTGDTRRLSTVRGPVEVEASPQVSPDGSQYAYVTSQYFDERYRNFEIAVSDMNGPRSNRITADSHLSPKTDTHPSWSPDGTTLAFVKNDEPRDDITPGRTTAMTTIYTVPAHGGETAALYPTAGQIQSLKEDAWYPKVVDAPVWSPDSRRIAFKAHHSGKGNVRYESVFITDLEHFEVTEVLRTNRAKVTIAGPIAWSPDGKNLTVIRAYPADHLSPSTPPELISVALNGTQRKILTFDDSVPAWAIRNMEWSPNGQNLLVSLGHSRLPPELDASVMIVDPEYALTQWLRDFGYYASWAPDGNTIAALAGYHLTPTEPNSPPQKIIRLVTRKLDESDPQVLLEARLVENPD